jgi:ATP-dependent DNA helicase PIF1
MCIKNSQDKKYVNGSLGTVIDFEATTDYPVVKLRNDKIITVGPDTWELRDGDKKRAGLTQIPLRLAWAITVHKSQGMTLDAARIDLRRAFVEGMGYVALSRVRSLETLSLIGVNRMALRISNDALEIDKKLREKAELDVQKYEHLRGKAPERVKIIESKKTSTWHERLAKMREKHPNAYKPWSESDDGLLKEKFLLGESVKNLSSQFGRHEGSIRSRLKKHFGEEVVSA